MHNKQQKPLVSICCITYNHVNFIHKAIEGFLSQITDFPIEIIIHDDASTDGTAEIIKRYAKEHKDLIVPIYQKENQYSKGIKPIFQYVLPRTRGKYIALCEGDDFWCDKNKLKIQIAFMEKKPEICMSFHSSFHLLMSTGKYVLHKPDCEEKTCYYDISKVLINGGGFITTNSMVFRSEHINEIPRWLIIAPTGDYALSLMLAHKGRIAYIDTPMSVYRKGVDGSWSKRSRSICYQLKWMIVTNRMLKEFNRWSGYKYNNLTIKRQFMNYRNFLVYFLSKILKRK